MIKPQLNKPYPFTSDLKRSAKTIMVIGVSVFALMFIFRSNITNNEGVWVRLLASSYFGFFAIIIPFINTLIIQKLVPANKETNWTVKNEITIYLLHFITIGNYILLINISEELFSFFNFIETVFLTTIIGGIPVTIHILNEQKKLLKKHVDEAHNINTRNNSLPEQAAESILSLEIESYSFKPNEILFIESNKNYLNIYFKNNTSKSIRFTLKDMEIKLENFTQFVRCHRAYIVNLSFLEKVEGNAQGLKLFLDNCNDPVPVSRTFIPIIKRVVRP